MASVTNEKRKEIEKKREVLIKAFLDNKWKRNPRYTSTNLLLSEHENYALTVKKQVITLHDASRQYCKILSMEIDKIKILPDGIQCGALKLHFDDL
jgi:hypothetical protein